MLVVDIVIAVLAVAVLFLLAGSRVVKQYERALIFRLGRLRSGVRSPGYSVLIPGVDRMVKVNMQIVTVPIPSQEGITRDNVTVRVDAVVYFKVVHPVDAVINVEDYHYAVLQVAQTSLRSIIGKSDLDDLLSNREKLNEGLALMIDSPALGWGVQIDRVEIKDVSLPETMKRSMARQAEAARDRRARVINADAELQASKKLAQAGAIMSDQPAALQLRLLQTVTTVAAEKNSTLVLPFPVELLRFLERSGQSGSADVPAGAARLTTLLRDDEAEPEPERPEVAAHDPGELGPGPMIDPLAEGRSVPEPSPDEWSDDSSGTPSDADRTGPAGPRRKAG